MAKKGKRNGNRKDDGDGGGGKDKKGKGKGGKTGKGRSECGWFTDASVYDDNSSSESKLKAARDAKKWYDAFTHTIRLNDIKTLRDKAVPFKISWDVAAVLSQLNDVYGRVVVYQNQADAEVRRLEGLVGTGLGGVLNNTLVDADSGSAVDTYDTLRMTSLFKEGKLLLGSMSVYTLVKSSMRILLAEAKKVAEKAGEIPATVSKGPVGIDYDTFHRCFYAHFGTQSDLVSKYSVKFSVKDSKPDHVVGMLHYTLPTPGPDLVRIVPYVSSENELKLASRSSSSRAAGLSSTTRRSTRTGVSI